MAAYVKFRESEFRDDFETEVLEIAEHFKIKRKYYMSFTGLIYDSSKWNTSNIEAKLSKWEAYFLGVGGDKDLVENVKCAFDICKTSNAKIRKLRGRIVEALLIGNHGGRDRLNFPSKYGWGSKVIVQTDTEEKEINYQCNEACPAFKGTSCGDREAVDVGYWDNDHAYLFECKTFPSILNCKDIEYLKKVSNELQNHSIIHEIFICCVDEKKEIENKLKELNAPLFFQAKGRRELESIISAS